MRRVWVAPSSMGLITVMGLICALLGDGVWDMLSWVALAIPVALCIFYTAKSVKSR